jgi:hypothetical protein
MRAPGQVVRRTRAAAERALKAAFSHGNAVRLITFWGWVHIRFWGQGGTNSRRDRRNGYASNPKTI